MYICDGSTIFVNNKNKCGVMQQNVESHRWRSIVSIVRHVRRDSDNNAQECPVV